MKEARVPEPSFAMKQMQLLTSQGMLHLFLEEPSLTHNDRQQEENQTLPTPNQRQQ